MYYVCFVCCFTSRPWTFHSFGLFVCLGVFVPLENFSLIWRRHHWDEGLCLALMAIEQWRFFSVPHLLWYGASVYHGHLRGPMTHIYCRAYGSGAVTIPVFTTKVLSQVESNTQFSACEANALTHCAMETSSLSIKGCKFALTAL